MLLNYTPPQSPYLDILYQDDAVVVFNKPSGLLTVPGKAPEHKDSLEYRARLVWPSVRVVHRLDMATSGVGNSKSGKQKSIILPTLPESSVLKPAASTCH